mmetsp:Transcript_44712/g.50128  ORF Transcript_44712/g.50128 Transcript_44712/m.50128 type:complete len:327 (+) Transcript_44712:112-1092(+)
MSDSFLKSMTFSTPGIYFERDNCDCSEFDTIPLSIRNAINKRKRLRLQTKPIKRTQGRTLIRHNGNGNGSISIYSLSMPKDAEPLLEFGCSHRIVWIRRLVRPSKCTKANNSTSILQWIGKGIIGSSDEEKGRKYLNDFTEGGVFLVPSNGGKAIGWIHTTTTDHGTTTDENNNTATTAINSNVIDITEYPKIPKSNDQEEEINTNNNNDGGRGDVLPIKVAVNESSDGNAILYVAKIPLNVLDQGEEDDDGVDNDDDDNCHWVGPLIKGCRMGLESMMVSDSYNNSKMTGSNNDRPNIVPPLYHKFSNDVTKLLQKAILEAERKS